MLELCGILYYFQIGDLVCFMKYVRSLRGCRTYIFYDFLSCLLLVTPLSTSHTSTQQLINKNYITQCTKTQVTTSTIHNKNNLLHIQMVCRNVFEQVVVVCDSDKVSQRV
eukprot:Phypoly_transcript_25445.p1 GENE.Phypoly_transcript_25445~~Phypoly_transcript_25445.p1  ORF type:complete len:110 (+),score=12.03 Phypoly_transcript_25445:192-521(+)